LFPDSKVSTQEHFILDKELIGGNVSKLPSVKILDINYAQSAIFAPSNIPFTKDAIQAKATLGIETVIIDDLDLELLKQRRKTGTVLNWEDRRKDLYDILFKK